MEVHRNSKVIRLLNVIMDLAQRGGRTLEELAESYEVDTRTIRRDVTAIEEAGIEVEKKNGRFCIPVGQPLFPSLQMTPDEAFLFSFCVAMMGRDALPRDRSGLSRLRKRVQVLLPKSVSEIADRLAGLYLPMNRPVQAIEYDEDVLRSLEEGVTGRIWVRFLYTKRDDERPSEYVVFPHALLTCYGRIYLLGHKRENIGEQPILFAVQRIQDVEIVDPDEEDYAALGLESPDEVRAQDFTEKSFGVWQEDPVDVEIIFCEDAVETIKTTVFHPSQGVEILPDGRAKFTLHCGGTNEMIWWVMGFGDKAEVVKPEEMRKEILETLRRMTRIYQNESVGGT
jgi:predicted DNA-binding transcriptional regulator YafY